MDSNSLSEVVSQIWDFSQEELNWEFFLHKVYDKSYSEFIQEITPKEQETIKKEEVEATVVNSKNILDGFIPEERSK